MELTKRVMAELIGTFILVFAGCGAIAVNQISAGALGHAGIAATFGLVIVAMVYTTGHISGAHLNPAVTLGFAATRNFPATEILPYLSAQFAGATLASVVHAVTLTSVLQRVNAGAVLKLGVTLPVDNTFATAFSWEFLLTFVLMFVIMAVATDARAVGAASGLAIGATVWLDALFGGPVTGASMNPARSFGPALVSGEWSHFGAYVLGPVAGAVAAAFVYRFMAAPESARSRPQ